MTLALPVITPTTLSPAAIAALQQEIRTLARQRNAVILAHNYERPEVQDVAEFVGDSLGLSRKAAATFSIDCSLNAGTQSLPPGSGASSMRRCAPVSTYGASC